MTDEIAKFNPEQPTTFMGASIAPFNDPTKAQTVDRIRAERRRELDAGVFAENMALLEEHFGVTWSEALYKSYFFRLKDEMSSAEFAAACWDALATKMFARDVIAFLIQHVRNQREQIDMGQLMMNEMDS